MSLELFVQILTSVLSALGVGLGVYTGVKVDLAVTRRIAEAAETASVNAHRRIDDMFKRN